MGNLLIVSYACSLFIRIVFFVSLFIKTVYFLRTLYILLENRIFFTNTVYSS